MKTPSVRRQAGWAAGALGLSIFALYFLGCVGSSETLLSSPGLGLLPVATGPTTRPATTATPATAATTAGPPQKFMAVQMQTVNGVPQFSPQKITVAVGGTVTWTNVDNMPHTATADPLDPVGGGPNSDLMFPAGVPPTISYLWQVPANAKPGTVWFYHCRFHGVAGNGTSLGTGMVGSVTVQ